MQITPHQAQAHSNEPNDRLHRLTEVIDWAETEATALHARDAGMCLQLARLALQARRPR